ncbi:hypothetical protein BH09DEP1_BH09DEP1_6420 [soil metagenome]
MATNPIHFDGAHHFMDLFVANKFDINARDKYGWTPLFSLITNYYRWSGRSNLEPLEKVEKLLKLGADPNIPNNKKSNSAYDWVRTPLGEVLALNPTSYEMINLLKFYGGVEKLPAKPRRWQIHQSTSQKNATFSATLNKKMKTTLNIGNPFSQIAASQAFRDKKERYIPEPNTYDDKRMEDVD